MRGAGQGWVHTGVVNVNDAHEQPNDDEDGEPGYAKKVNAPLTPETIKALRKQLESGEYAKFRRPRKD